MLVPLVPLAPAGVLIAFAAAGAAAQGKALNTLVDLQIGESGRFLRVALMCETECPSRARPGGGFFIPGLDADVDVDLKAQYRNASRIKLFPANGGSQLTLESKGPMRRAAINPCEIGGARATCIDIEFGASPAQASSSPQVLTPEPPNSENAAAQMPVLAAVAAVPARDPPPPPPLREAPEEAALVFASLAPPERLAPSAILGSEAARPMVRDDAMAKKPVEIGEAAASMLGKQLGVAECEAARAKLRTDAWALEAMVDVGFCDAVAGDLDAADGIFIRLLAYTPDNYEALVGRGLIAAKRGVRFDARNFFQQALNALPPMAQSDRIEAAMKSL